MLKLILGLANPGEEYRNTRHNAGAWFIEALAQQSNANFHIESKLKCQLAQMQLHEQAFRLAVPTVYMNESGQSAAALLNFYKIKPEELLVVHDDIDLPPGTVRLKFAGGEGGHNGLRDIAKCIGTKNFHRLRIGVGHPGNSKQVVNYVLKKPSKTDQTLIDESVQRALDIMPYAVAGNFEKAMHHLHTT